MVGQSARAVKMVQPPKLTNCAAGNGLPNPVLTAARIPRNALSRRAVPASDGASNRGTKLQVNARAARVHGPQVLVVLRHMKPSSPEREKTASRKSRCGCCASSIFVKEVKAPVS